MKFSTLIGTLFLSAASAGTAFAAQQTVTLAVDNMTCSTCPYTVKKALNQVLGVENATVSYEEKKRHRDLRRCRGERGGLDRRYDQCGLSVAPGLREN